MNKASLGFIKDNLLNLTYELVRFESAKELSSHLKSVLIKENINYNQYNSYTSKKSWDNEDNSIENPPAEIYEYQNFFLLEKSNGDYLLLDGFRRLLWYDAPESPILVRIYKEEHLSSQEILTLLVYLNHFKFIGSSGGSYYDRGFALLLRTVFDLDILKFKETFNAYLNSKKIKNDYSSDNSINIETTKERILNPFFVDDIKFINKLQEAGGMINKFFGALLYKERSNYNKPFHVEEFIKLQMNSKVLQNLLEKFKKTGTSTSSASQIVINQIQEIYENMFIQIKGGTVEKSYAEIKEDCKQISEEIKKDKNWTKLTGNQGINWLENYIYKNLKAGEEFKFKCVIYPYAESSYDARESDKVINVEPGLREDIKLLKYFTGRQWGATEEIEFGFEQDGKSIGIRHNYGGQYRTYGKKYTEIEFGSMPSKRMDVDLYINIPKVLSKEIVQKK